MHSGNKPTTPCLHVHDAPRWLYRPLRRIPNTPTSPCAPCKPTFTGSFILDDSDNKTRTAGTSMSATDENSQTNTRAGSTQPHTPLLSMWKHRNVLPCLGNTVCWRLALPTMLPGHGRTFLSLLHRRPSLISPPYTATTNSWHEMGREGKILRVVKNHPRISSLLRLPINIGCPGTNR